MSSSQWQPVRAEDENGGKRRKRENKECFDGQVTDRHDPNGQPPIAKYTLWWCWLERRAAEHLRCHVFYSFAFVDPFYLNLLNLLISFTNFVFNTWSASNCFSISGGRTLRQERTGASRDAEDTAVHNRSSIVCLLFVDLFCYDGCCFIS